MNRVIYIIFLIIIIWLCVNISTKQDDAAVQQLNHTSADVHTFTFSQKVYVAVHSNAYTQKKYNPQYLHSILKIRNTSPADSLYISTIEYYDKDGGLLKKYLDKTIVLKPLETFETINSREAGNDKLDNFMVTWHAGKAGMQPIIQAIMYDATDKILFSIDGVNIDGREKK